MYAFDSRGYPRNCSIQTKQKEHTLHKPDTIDCNNATRIRYYFRSLCMRSHKHRNSSERKERSNMVPLTHTAFYSIRVFQELGQQLHTKKYIIILISHISNHILYRENDCLLKMYLFYLNFFRSRPMEDNRKA